MVGARVRPMETAPETVSPEGEPTPLPGHGPAWSRLRYPPKSNGNDRNEAMVAVVEEGTGKTKHPNASVVWNDGTEQDGVLLANLGPCVGDKTELKVPTDEGGLKHISMKTSALETAAASSDRGAFRFRLGDFAAAAAEYTEACAALLEDLPNRNRLLPGDANVWTLPGVKDKTLAEKEIKQTVTVGARVRVLNSVDGTSRPAMVACVDSDDETCDVFFENETGENERVDSQESEEEEEGVAFSRVYPASVETETYVSYLANALTNVCRCHLRVLSDMNGGISSAFAAESAATASLSIRRDGTCFFLRGKARLARRKFSDARSDLKQALDEAQKEEKKKSVIAAITAMIRETAETQKRVRDADKKLAKAILGHVHKSGKDLRLDPKSNVAKTGYEDGKYLPAAGSRKEGSVAIGNVARVVGERVAQKRCVVS